MVSSVLLNLAPGCTTLSNSACHIIGHVPWTFQYLSKLPGATKAIDEGLRIGREIAQKRKELGSDTRDLYYYLVSFPVLHSMYALINV